jgi:pyruvate/2-oxoglutarate/acetoin dehydrogenase E1 component
MSLYGSLFGRTVSYNGELSRAMTWLGQQERVMFFGQGVGCEGTALSSSLTGVPIDKRIEMPVAEEMQMGMCIGMSLNGYVPVCIIPRWNFMLRAADQLVNHLDRIPLYSSGGYWPKVIIRVAAPSSHPFNPQSQHDADFTEAFRRMFRTTALVRLIDAGMIVSAYQNAFEAKGSTVLVEYAKEYR